MARAVPCMLIRVPFQCTAEVRTAFLARSEQANGSFKSVCRKLRAHNAARRGEQPRILVFAVKQHVCQYSCRYHSGAHAPFIKACRYKQIMSFLRVTANIGHPVQGHAVLCCPAVLLECYGVVSCGEALKLLQPPPCFPVR